MATNLMRKISKYEINKVARIFADIFSDYRAYDLFFKRDCIQKLKIKYFFIYEIYASQNYTYVYDDYSAVAAVKMPGDIDKNPKSLFKNPFFSAVFSAVTGRKARKLANEYMKFADEISKKHYNPETDCYIKNIGVRKEFRGQGKLKSMLNEICGDMPIYLETHDKNNVSIYEKLGFRLCESADFHGETHFAMRRD